ncbi:MAG: hypothetical protein J5827_02735 [Oscillospiraceae bacterium]|nr:hypothetical protein [Oscillospiraceae bacterium]
MTKKGVLSLKAGLLCLGAKVDGDTASELLREYPHFFDKGFIHAVNIRLRESNINISVAERFAADSPYSIVKESGGYRVRGNGYDEPIKFFDALPHTGTVVDDMARLHSDGCINIWPSTVCCYDEPGRKCRFCSLKADRSMPVDIGELCEGIKRLLEQTPSYYMLNFSGGTYRDPDTMLRYWIELTKAIRAFSDCSIAIEFAPPTDFGLLEELRNAGCTAVIMNLEVADPELRREICPGKSSIPYERYHAAFRRSAELFGRGMVSSVLIGGIQPKEDIIRECAVMAAEGVFPTIMPFRPMDDCEFSGLSRCDPAELEEMSIVLGGLLIKHGLQYSKQEGCTKCGGCSLENDCYDSLLRRE